MAESTYPSLKRRILKAGGWTVVGFSISQMIRFGSNLLMTRLLVPEMFGVMAIAYMIMYGLALFSDVGLRQNIVQSKRGNDPAFLNTAWTIQILRGVLIWLFAIAVSLLVVLGNHFGIVPSNSVYAHPSLPYVILILSVSAVIDGFGSSTRSGDARDLCPSRLGVLPVLHGSRAG